MSEINYHELAKAQAEYPDNEADRIAATIPDELKNHVSTLYVIPARGTVPPDQRLAKAREVETRTKNTIEREAAEVARKSASLAAETARREQYLLLKTLGLPSWPANLSASDAQRWAGEIKAGRMIPGDVKRTLDHWEQQAREKAAAAGQPAQPPTPRLRIF